MEKVSEFNDEILSSVKEYFLTDRKSEKCGFIVDNEKELLFIPAKNISKQNNKNFIIDPSDYLAAAKSGKIIACCHSHIKDGSFSVSDIYNSFNHNIKYVLYNLKKDRFYFFDPQKFIKYKKYIDLSFELGKNDCANLICDFYKQQLNVDIPMRPILDNCKNYEELKSKKLHIWDGNLYKKNWDCFNFFKIKSFDELKIYDILIFNDISKNPVHAAIYLGEELILHQTVGYPSRIEGLRKFHLKFISYVARLKNDTI